MTAAPPRAHVRASQASQPSCFDRTAAPAALLGDAVAPPHHLRSSRAEATPIRASGHRPPDAPAQPSGHHASAALRLHHVPAAVESPARLHRASAVPPSHDARAAAEAPAHLRARASAARPAPTTPAPPSPLPTPEVAA